MSFNDRQKIILRFLIEYGEATCGDLRDALVPNIMAQGTLSKYLGNLKSEKWISEKLGKRYRIYYARAHKSV